MKLVKLSTCVKADALIQDLFAAEVEGEPVLVTAVLERTAVYAIRVNGHEERRLARLDKIMVDASCLVYRKIQGPAAMYAKGRAKGKATQLAQKEAAKAARAQDVA